MTNANDSAFLQETKANDEGLFVQGYGLTKREYFAAMAMQGRIASYAGTMVNVDPNKCAERAVEFADALITSLNKTESI